jgi:hypothetical protein
MKITDVQVLTNNGGTDKVWVLTDLPSPFPGDSNPNLTMQFEAPAGTGVAYAIEHFGINPMLIDRKAGVGYRHGE